MTDLGSFVGPLPTQAQEPDSFDRALHGGWSFILDYPRPPKGLHANDRAHWAVKMGATADIRQEVMARTRNLHIPTVDRIQVDVAWVVGDRRKRDTDNLAPFMKAIYDGIGSDRGVSAHLVKDDDPAHMVKPAATIQYTAGARACFVVTITDLAVESGGQS